MQTSRPVFSLIIGLLVVFLPAAFAAADSSTETAALQVDGMTCGSCAAGVQAVLGNLRGVQTAEVSFDKGQAIVRFDPESVSLEELAESIKDLGYEASVLPAGAVARAGDQEALDSSCNDGEGAPVDTADDTMSRADKDKVVDYVIRQLTGEDDSLDGPISRTAIYISLALPLSTPSHIIAS